MTVDVQKFRDSMVAFVDQFDWQIYMTGTFLPDQSYRDTIKTKRAFERYIEDLRKKYKKSEIEYFMVVERFKHGDFTHIHALLNGLDGLSYRQIGETWRDRFGREQVERFEKGKGADFYLTKYLLKDVCDWDLHIIKTKSHALKFKE